ncbi:MAG: UDP-N-acetylmuramoyl-L-alanine--D-glutamate ligase [Rhodospirillaceae bacterium]|nr:UDP-N-acetylmuramoyl-L-alanine--D-glutamate ligase [Rhodospirillaceae bacterium]MDE0617193.1 UDP-N-acetylmuramoyl-L-alanine--D-glutamate ligase [Rhodospirillaceae bacterium]
MIPVPSFANKRVAVMGLGVAGLATARALAASGADVLAWDDSEAGRTAAAAAGIAATDLGAVDWTADLPLVLSPGIPDEFPAPHPVAAAARAAKAEILCDIELLARSVPAATCVTVTGTNGKSTTTALIGHILRAAGRRVEVGGNFGPPALGLEPLDAGGIYVLELSSYQLDRTYSLRAKATVLLNIAEDHLERHGGLDGYIAAKRRTFDLAAPNATVVVGVDDPEARALASQAEEAGQTVIRVSGRKHVEGGVGVLDGILRDDTADGSGSAGVPVDPGGTTALRGAHNHQNAAAAWAACRALGVAPETVAAAFATFSGLPHRQERVGEASNGGRTVSFVNDSKATNAVASARALSTYGNIFWIAGGRGKLGGYAALAPALAGLRGAFLIGEDAPAMARFLAGAAPSAPVTVSGTLDQAVADAWTAATSEDAPANSVILLSPACASFDQFANFGARGDAFRKSARNLIARNPSDRYPIDRTGGAA